MKDEKIEYTDDFKPYLEKAINAGLSQARVAREIGLSRATVNIVRKQDGPWIPGYNAGKRLLDLLDRITKL